MRRNWVIRLVQWLGFGRQPEEIAASITTLRSGLEEHLASVDSKTDALSDALSANASASLARLEALQAAIQSLDGDISRVGREQFKANTINTALSQNVREAVQKLTQFEADRDLALLSRQTQLENDQSAQRLVVIQRLLPVVDGLQDALTAGKRLFANLEISASSAPPPAAPGWKARLSLAWQILWGQAVSPEGQPGQTPFTDEGLTEVKARWGAWLDGIEMVQARLLDVLAAEDVAPVGKAGEMFNPERHLAVEVVPADEHHQPGEIVRNNRLGYLKMNRENDPTVLRYAEVVVARQVMTTEEAGGPDAGGPKDDELSPALSRSELPSQAEPEAYTVPKRGTAVFDAGSPATAPEPAQPGSPAETEPSEPLTTWEEDPSMRAFRERHPELFTEDEKMKDE